MQRKYEPKYDMKNNGSKLNRIWDKRSALKKSDNDPSLLARDIIGGPLDDTLLNLNDSIISIGSIEKITRNTELRRCCDFSILPSTFYKKAVLGVLEEKKKLKSKTRKRIKKGIYDKRQWRKIKRSVKGQRKYSVPTYDLSKFGDRAFSVTGPLVSFSPSLRLTDSYTEFRRQLKPYLFKQALTLLCAVDLITFAASFASTLQCICYGIFVCLSVCPSVSHISVLRQNKGTQRDAVFIVG